MAQICMISLWRDDAEKDIEGRTAHLLAKTAGEGNTLRWVWVVGDSSDDTETRLHQIAKAADAQDITIIKNDTKIEGEDPNVRVRRLSVTANAALDEVRLADDYVVIHESDLISPVDVIERFLATGKCPVAGWVSLGEDKSFFYDTWAYRAGGGCMFQNRPPYHKVYLEDELFQVESVGSVWMMWAEDILAGCRMDQLACLDLCEQMRELDREFWVDPRIHIIQPESLFVSRGHAG